MSHESIGILGATSLVGHYVIDKATKQGYRLVAFSRKAKPAASGQSVQWVQLPDTPSALDRTNAIPFWVSFMPVWVLPDYFPMLEAYQATRVIALSSTSLFTKVDSNVSAERDIASRLAEGEQRLSEWSEKRNIEWVVLRPTLIYGGGRDKNIVEIIRFISRFGFFPLFGKAQGLRQPIHGEDLANACLNLLSKKVRVNCSYNLSGAEILPYREMVERIFNALHRKPRFVFIPLFIFQWGIALLRLLPRYRHWSVAMAERMNSDMVFSHDEAVQDFDFMPRMFELCADDVNIKY